MRQEGVAKLTKEASQAIAIALYLASSDLSSEEQTTLRNAGGFAARCDTTSDQREERPIWLAAVQSRQMTKTYIAATKYIADNGIEQVECKDREFWTLISMRAAGITVQRQAPIEASGREFRPHEGDARLHSVPRRVDWNDPPKMAFICTGSHRRSSMKQSCSASCESTSPAWHYMQRASV